jgi:hypothetical protein
MKGPLEKIYFLAIPTLIPFLHEFYLWGVGHRDEAIEGVAAICGLRLGEPDDDTSRPQGFISYFQRTFPASHGFAPGGFLTEQ